MWLRNWDNIQRIRTSYSVETVYTTEFNDNSKMLKDIRGALVKGYIDSFYDRNNACQWGMYYTPSFKPMSGKQPVYNGDLSNYSFFNNIYGPLSVYYGTGTNEVTYDDYNITKNENLIITETLTPFYSTDTEKKEEFCILGVTVKNNSENELSVTEVGLFVPYSLSSSSFNGTLLVYRDLLTTPQTLQPGEIRTLYLELRRKYSQE